jgi:glycosyltransferase involved in cell wall biosynthesis
VKIIEVGFSGTVGTTRMGPVSTDILELANRFTEQGHEVVLTDIATRAPRDLLHEKVKLVELTGEAESLTQSETGNRVERFLRPWKNCYGYVRALVSCADVAGADIFHFHSHLPAFFAQRFYGVRTAYTAHTPLWALPEPRENGVRGRAARFSPQSHLHDFIEKSVIRRSDVTVGLGDYLADSAPGANVATIPNGLDCKNWPPVDRASARAALGLRADEFVVVFAGRIHAEKGIDILLEAVRLVAPSMPRLNVRILGPLSGSFDSRDESVTAYARALMSSSQGLPVRFMGFISNRDLEYRSYLAAADVFVLPSRREPQGMVVLEAMAMGTPVIGSATGGIADMISPDVGYLFTPADAQALAARLREANDDAETLARMGKNARARVEKLYSWEHAASRYLDEFEKVIRKINRGNVARVVPREA